MLNQNLSAAQKVAWQFNIQDLTPTPGQAPQGVSPPQAGASQAGAGVALPTACAEISFCSRSPWQFGQLTRSVLLMTSVSNLVSQS